jgi:hypothetical protein
MTVRVKTLHTQGNVLLYTTNFSSRQSEENSNTIITYDRERCTVHNKRLHYFLFDLIKFFFFFEEKLLSKGLLNSSTLSDKLRKQLFSVRRDISYTLNQKLRTNLFLEPHVCIPGEP